MAQNEKIWDILQEDHCTKEKERLWSSEWGFSAIFSSVSSSSAGVCILFNNNFQFEIKKQFSDPDGRFILVDLKLENKTITLGNIYAPNNDNPNFFKNVLSHLRSFECENIILGGDFNLVLDVQNDKRGGRLTTQKNLSEGRPSLDLIDHQSGYQKIHLEKKQARNTLSLRLFLDEQ